MIYYLVAVSDCFIICCINCLSIHLIIIIIIIIIIICLAHLKMRAAVVERARQRPDAIVRPLIGAIDQL